MKIIGIIVLAILSVLIIWFLFEGFRLWEHNCNDCIFAKNGKCLLDGYSTMTEGVCWDFKKKRKKL